MRPIGADGQHVKYQLRLGRNCAVEALDFGGAERALGSGRLRAAYQLGINRYREGESLELRLEYLAPC